MPDGSGSRRRREAFAAIAAWSSFGVFWGGWGALIPEIKDATGASEAELGLALLFVAAGALASMPLTGILVDRFGERVLVPALALFAASVVLPGLAGSVFALAAALAVVGAASGALDIAMTARVVGIESRRDTRLMSRAHGAFALSAVVGSVAVGLAREAGLGRAPILVALAVPILAVAVVNAPLARRAPRPERPRPRGRRPRLTRALAFLGLLYALALVVENALEQWSAVHLEETLGATPALGALGPALFSLGLFAGRALTFLYERRIAETTTVRVSAVGAVGGLLLLALAPNQLVGLLGAFAAGFAIAPAAPTIISFVGRSASAERRGSAISVATTMGYLGYLLGPVFVGAVAGLAGLRVGLVSVAAVSALLALATLLRLAAAPARTAPVR